MKIGDGILKVVDSSYLVEGLLKSRKLLEADLLITLDLALYEVANSIWKHEFLLKDVKDGTEYLSILQGLVETGAVRLLHASTDALKIAYSLATENKRSIYDAAFVSLALELDSELSTFDRSQKDLFKRAGVSRRAAK
jgi:predicted nucleic acid-binding protein